MIGKTDNIFGISTQKLATLLEVHIKQLNSLLPHLPYSLDLAPSDYHLFVAIKDASRGKHYGNDEEVKIAVKNWL